MDTRWNTTPLADGVIAIEAATLKEAYRRIKKEHGDEVEILGSRTVSRRHPNGLGEDRGVEVMVRRPGSTASLTPPRPAAAPAAGATTVEADALVREVERIEALVESISGDVAARLTATAADESPLALHLMEQGASPTTVHHLLTRFRGETGQDPTNRPALIEWLADSLAASNCEWDGFYGCHAFLGTPGCGRSELVLAAASRLQELGRRVLVLAVTPSHDGEIRRLQKHAATAGYDAAVLKKPEQLEASAAQLAQYDVVLVDLPRLDTAAMAEGGALHAWLAGNPGFHRHLVLPLDGDARDQADLAPRARVWNCDWIALSRTDGTRRWGKLLDLSAGLGLPCSLVAADALRSGSLEIARSSDLIDRVLGADTEAFVPAVPVTAEA